MKPQCDYTAVKYILVWNTHLINYLKINNHVYFITAVWQRWNAELHKWKVIIHLLLHSACAQHLRDLHSEVQNGSKLNKSVKYPLNKVVYSLLKSAWRSLQKAEYDTPVWVRSSSESPVVCSKVKLPCLPEEKDCRVTVL